MPSYTSSLTPPANLAEYYASQQQRIPGGTNLEQASSDAIMGLLNPPSMFPDVNRQAAEVTAGRGIGGSAAAYGTGLRMTDDERIRRIALGEQLLTSAFGRQPTVPADFFGLTPYQSAQIDLRNRELDQAWWNNGANRRPVTSVSTSGMGGGGGIPSNVSNVWGAPAVNPSDWGYTDWHGTRITEPSDTYLPGFSYPNPSGQLLPLYPGGEPVGSTGYDGGFFGGGYTPPAGTADYTGYTGIAGLENLDSGGGLADFSGLLDYYSGE